MRPEGSQGATETLGLSAEPGLCPPCCAQAGAGRCLPVGLDPSTHHGRAGVAQGHPDLVLGSVASVTGWIFLTSFFCPPPNLPSQHRNCLLMLTTTQITN